MIPVIVILLYLCVVAYIGSVAFRKGKENTEDFFLAGRTIGTAVFFLSLFATNMTAFAILGSSGAAYKQGIGIFGMMASSSGIVIPLTIFFIGTRIWSLGKRFGHMTQVQFFRDRWECSGVGTFLFFLSAAMLIPYMIISIIGGGQVLQDISRSSAESAPIIPYWLGCLIVTIVVTVNVFFGGMRGVVWVNVFQTVLFLLFGTVAFITIGQGLPGGLSDFVHNMAKDPVNGALLSRERMPAEVFWSYMFIPLSSIMFPHMSIMCLSAKKMSAFKQTVVVYPIAIMLIWLPCVFLGALGAQAVPGLKETDGVLLHLLSQYAPAWLAGLLGAGIISAVMGSDCHQVLALSTMFTKDIFSYYGGLEKYGEKGMVYFARAFVLIVTAIAYLIALARPTSIFELAIRFAFSGFAALSPIMIAALFWKRSTKYGALASGIWVLACVLGTWYLTSYSDSFAPKPPTPPAKSVALAEGKPSRTEGTPSTNPTEGKQVAQLNTGAERQLTASPVGDPAGKKSPIADAPKKGGKPGAKAGKAGGKAGAKPKGVPSVPIFPQLGNMFLRSPTQVTVYGFLPVVPMVIGSLILMILVSLLTPPPSKETVDKYFPQG